MSMTPQAPSGIPQNNIQVLEDFGRYTVRGSLIYVGSCLHDMASLTGCFWLHEAEIPESDGKQEVDHDG